MKYNFIKRPTSERVKEFDEKVSKELGIIKKRYKSKTQEKNTKNKKYQDEVIKNWKMTGYFIEPTKEQIEKEIIKDELFDDENTIEDVSLEDCLPEDYENEDDI